jgi:hypothetical protein
MSFCNKGNKAAEYQVFTSSGELPDSWDAFLPEGHALKADQLAVTERSSLPGLSYLYVLMSQNGNPTAAVYFQTLKVSGDHINKEMVKPWQSRVWRLFTKATGPSFLIAGHLFRHDTSFFYRSPAISAYHAYQCFSSAIDIALKRTCAYAVLVKDMPAELVDHFQHHSPQYLLLRNDISMEMEIPDEWENIHNYEKALKHKYAQRFRKVRQQWGELEIKELSLDEVRSNEQKIHRLYQQVVANQQIRLGLLSSSFIVNLKEHYGDQLKIWAAYKGGEMVAFFSGWAKKDAFDMFYIGFDYKQNGELQSYFNILFFSVEQSIDLKKSKLILGRTALDAKARIGCEPRYLHTFLYINNPIIRRFVLRKQQNVSIREGDWEEKHPFKEHKIPEATK